MHDIQLFGRLEVRTRGVRLSGRDFGGIKPRHILALLALRGPLGKTELTELLWDGKPPANNKATMESDVSVLRHRLDPAGPAGRRAARCARARPGLGRAAHALTLAERAVTLDPMAERGWAIRMAAHRALGDRVAALRAYARCRHLLTEGLGVEPSAGTRALFLELLREDPVRRAGAETALETAISAVLAAARAPHAPGSAVALLQRAADLAPRV